ncbi:MAG: EscU/YscU/HrcU family type III secretion system export apparatus switch protein [Acidimicrobiales bacterium]
MAYGDKQDKTEKPTPNRLKEGRKKGQIARSSHLSGWVSMLAASLILPSLFGAGEKRLMLLVSYCVSAMGHPSLPRDMGLLGLGLEDVLYISLPIIGAVTLVSLFVTFMQVRFIVTAEAMKPTFSRISPLNGIKRFFSFKTLWSLFEQTLVLIAISGVALSIITQVIHTLVGERPTALGPILGYLGSELLLMVRYVSLIGIVLGIVDYAFQRWQTTKSMKMSKQEVKEENRRYEAAPEMRQAVRKRQVRIARGRMMARVATADAVITNPTHLAVALQYNPKAKGAPKVVAKGAGWVALRIREEASHHGVPVVEDPPLARALYGACEMDDEIPVDLYVAVARLLAFVLTLPDMQRQSGTVHKRPTSTMVA